MLLEVNWNLAYSNIGIHKLFYYTDTSLKMYKPEVEMNICHLKLLSFATVNWFPGTVLVKF